MDNALEILGLEPGDSLEKAHKKRNALFLKLHPDKNPPDKEMFKKVYDAYEAIEKNPSLLDVKKQPKTLEKPIRIKITVTLEDFYFKKKQTVSINRKIFCRKCKGSGSEIGEHGKCEHCAGTGKINSEILALLNKSSTCPICKGTGIKPGSICTSCQGAKFEFEIKSISFKLSPYNYHKQAIVIHNVGNQINTNLYGSVVVLLDILSTDSTKIEEDYFVVYDRVLPIQKIIGDNKTIKVFGRDVPYIIAPNSTESYVTDNISASVSQRIRIKFIGITPRFTEETTKLYKQILEIEKNIDHTI